MDSLSVSMTTDADESSIKFSVFKSKNNTTSEPGANTSKGSFDLLF